VGGETVHDSVVAKEGRVDPATLMILRALAGERGKVEIGGRLFDFYGVTSFRLRDCETGSLLVCGDTVSLLKTILNLLRDAKEESHRRLFSSATQR
jgi:hypothetical protein